MTGASSLAFPGGRTLAGWWRQLTVRQAEFFWVGYLFLHHVEALASTAKLQIVDRLSALVLQALESARREHSEPDATLLARLEERLHLGTQVIVQLLRGLAADGLVHSPRPNVWAATSLGLQALTTGTYPSAAWERRVFPFVERVDASGVRLEPHFLNVPAGRGVPWQPGDDCRFDINLVRAAASQSAEWKQRHAFPGDVDTVAGGLDSTSLSLDASAVWQRVALDRPERVLVALIRSPLGLLGFSARQEGWSLQTTEPLFSLGIGWESVFPALRAEPATGLNDAWQTWCKTRSLEPESQSCELAGNRLRVTVPRETLSRWKASRADLWKGETWLLLGEGLLRPAVLLEVVAAS